MRSYLCLAVALTGCQSHDAADGAATAPSRVDVVDSHVVEASDLIADGGSFRDRGNPFWQVVIDRRGIELHGAASPQAPSMTKLPPVRSTVHGSVETWVTHARGQPVKVQAIRERCVRDDGFVFRQKVTVQVGTRVLASCGERGSEPPAEKG